MTSSGEARVGEVSVVDTTELRWFAVGRVPREVTSWFTDAGTSGLSEERWDTYRIDGRPDIGVKRRLRETLELKVRLSVGTHAVDSHLAGAPEVWRKWSPADSLVVRGEDEPWVDVHKAVVKGRFRVGGDEVVLADGARAPTWAGCDVEVADVAVEDVEAWTFGLAAFGPMKERRNAILASWRALTPDSHYPAQLEALHGELGGYPSWLARVILHRSR